MELHHSKHHQTYVTNLNNALKSLADASKANDIDTQIALQSAINFHGGGHINHSLFWQNLSPASSPDAKPEAATQLLAEINQTWGSVAKFQEAFSAKLLAIQGSGWGWLVKAEGKQQLQIITTRDQDPVPNVFVPIFGVDMWEHAYYLQVSRDPSWFCPLLARMDLLTCRKQCSISTARLRMWRTSGRSSTGLPRRRDSSADVLMLSPS